MIKDYHSQYGCCFWKITLCPAIVKCCSKRCDSITPLRICEHCIWFVFYHYTGFITQSIECKTETTHRIPI